MASTLGVIVIASCIGFFQLYSKITSLNSQIYDQRVELAIFQEQRINIEKTKQDYNKIEKDINKVTSMFIDRKNIYQLIDTLETIASRHSIIQSINLPTEATQIQTNLLPLQISAQGTWQNLLSYLADLEHQDQYFVITSIKFSEVTGQLTFVFTSNLYLL
ncbi:MAG: type 4a pilus biogenesis protein PilO [Patescibacteria group bacterium]|nr:type 4a pilus biogenesis protein PilO [Patescibacteria group bacterium]MDD5715112.1 type 4a pilus biogenesis protein PilO [Patescibacteria group bacterium]